MRKSLLETCLFLIFFLNVISIEANNPEPSFITEIKKQTKSPQEAIAQAQILIKEENKEQNAELLKFIGSSYQTLSEWDKALNYYNLSLELSKDQNNKTLTSSNLYNIGTIYQNKGLYKEALNISLQALAIDTILGDVDNIISSLNLVAASYEKLDIYDKALDYQLQAVNLCEQHKKFTALANARFILANIYSKNDKNQQAKQYYFLAIKEYEKLLKAEPNKFQWVQTSSEIEYAIGSLFIIEEKFDSAFVYTQNALSKKERIDDKNGISKCFLQLSNISFHKHNLEEALQYNFQALQYKLLLNDIEGKALIYSNIGKIKMRLGQLNEAITFILKSNVLAESISAHHTLKENHEMLSQLYAQNQQFENALIHKRLYAAELDTIHKIQGRHAVEEMSIRFETEKTEQQNILLQKDNDLQQLTIKKQRLVNYMLLGIAVLILVIFIILFFQFKEKKRANKLMLLKNEQLNEKNFQIEYQKNKIEEVNKDLTDSIRYAKRIQDSMLGDPESILKELADSFIFFKPKDIVSGDFYWIGKNEDKIILSVIDCTGHGVPGAFMSMLGDSYLNQIVYNHNITSPDEILNQLNQKIQEALNQRTTQNRDGMDMVICTIDLQAKILEFATAKNPMVYIQNGELTKVRGQNKAIGGDAYQEEPFKKHLVKLNVPTSFYMFSDGYQDQFGGADDKKFMVKKMTNLLLENHTKPMKEQKKIMENALNDWMGSTPQIDDITLIGFKIDV